MTGRQRMRTGARWWPPAGSIRAQRRRAGRGRVLRGQNRRV